MFEHQFEADCFIYVVLKFTSVFAKLESYVKAVSLSNDFAS